MKQTKKTQKIKKPNLKIKLYKDWILERQKQEQGAKFGENAKRGLWVAMDLWFFDICLGKYGEN